MNAVKNIVQSVTNKFGYEVKRQTGDSIALSDLNAAEQAAVIAGKEFTMTSLERMAALATSVSHIVKNEIPGDFVECGVWRGGSMVIVAHLLLALGQSSKKLYLYDTFDGMPEPTIVDKSFRGVSASSEMAITPRGEGIWCKAGLEDVKQNVLSTGYPKENIIFIEGKVEDTIPATIPDDIALLRLDTDWYESTKHELEYLFPIVSQDGVIIIDDYGHWEGAKKAVDEYLASNGLRTFLHRVDQTARLLVKNGNFTAQA